MKMHCIQDDPTSKIDSKTYLNNKMKNDVYAIPKTIRKVLLGESWTKRMLMEVFFVQVGMQLKM